MRFELMALLTPVTGTASAAVRECSKILTCKGIRMAANTSEHTRAVTNGGQNHSGAKRIGGQTKTN